MPPPTPTPNSADADLIFECVPERLDLKQELLGKVTRFCPPTAVVATNTMTLSVADCAAKCFAPERVIGVRFLSPVLLIPDLELTAGAQTAQTVVDQGRPSG